MPEGDNSHPYDIPGTRELHEAPCPGCGLEPEVAGYFRRDGRRIGYRCSCGAVVIDGVVWELG